MKETFSAATEEAMLEVGRRLATTLRGGDALALVGDLGAGKTHFCKGLAGGLDADDPVTSPTFALVQEYRSGRLPLFHFDWYRIETPAELEAIGWDDYLDEDGIIVVEWADKFEALMPPGTTWLHFEILPDGTRRITATRP